MANEYTINKITAPNGDVYNLENTTYESKAAASGGTDVSLVTTGEKYTWNAKSGSDVNVKQEVTTGSANYEVLFSGTADNTTRSEGARKNNNLLFNPSTGNLQTTQLNGVTIGSSPKFTDTNTHRPIQMNGTEILGNNTTALNLKAGSNVSLSNSSGTVTIAATDTTYESKSAASGGTDVSLVTTGEKYTWNNKAAGNHTHSLSIATDSGNNQLTMAANTKYKLTAGGSTYIFTTPPDNNSDTKVTQTNSTTSADNRLVLSATADDTTRTEAAVKSTNFRANPSTGEFYAKGFRRIDITGQTVNINDYNLSAGTPNMMFYIEKTDGGANNITNIPVAGKPFLLDVEVIRWASTSDYITRQTFRNANNPANEYVRFCTNGTWGNWTTRVFTDGNNAVTQTATSTSANYEVLFSATADNTNRTEGARKNSNLLFNPSTGNLQATQLNGVTIGSSPKFTDNNTWNPMTGATSSANGTVGYVNAVPPKDGYNTKYLRADGSWQVPPNTTYSSKAAASGGTDVSLVTTGEKYTWNSKTSNTGTVTKVSTGTGLTGGDITTSGTISLASGVVTAGSAGPTAAVTGTEGTTIAVPRITVDTYGRVTGLTSYNLTNKNTTYSSQAAASGGTAVSLCTTGEKYTWNNKLSTAHTALTVTLSSSSWNSSKQQSVTASGVTASNTVMVSPAPASLAAYGGSGVYCSAQASNSLTFTYTNSKPSANLTVNVVILK